MCLGVLYLPEGLPLGPLGPWGQALADPGVTLGHMTNLLCQVCAVRYLAACFALLALMAFCCLRYDTVHVPSAVHVALGGGGAFITTLSWRQGSYGLHAMLKLSAVIKLSAISSALNVLFMCSISRQSDLQTE